MARHQSLFKENTTIDRMRTLGEIIEPKLRKALPFHLQDDSEVQDG